MTSLSLKGLPGGEFSYDLSPPSVPGLRGGRSGKSSSSANALCWLSPTPGASVGCREWGRSQRALFRNDGNVVGYVIGTLILLQTTQGCKGLVPASRLEPDRLERGRGPAFLTHTRRGWAGSEACGRPALAHPLPPPFSRLVLQR